MSARSQRRALASECARRTAVLARSARRPFVARLALAACVLALTSGPVQAHARLVKADPSPRSVIHAGPAMIRLWFSERIEPAFAAVSIVDARGQVTPLAHVGTAADDPKRVEAPAPVLQPGTYRVRYRVISVDGHVIEADYAFTLQGDDRRAGQPAAVARP